MAYKDKEKQREAVRQATQRYRLRLKGITKVSRVTGITLSDEACDVIPSTCEIPEQPLVMKPTVEPQSHNPMMVGYVPPTDW